MTLLDANVLVALVVAEHVHHEAAEAWLERLEGEFATCPFTQTALVRFLVREGRPAREAAAVLAALARARSGRLATFDRALAAVHPDVATWIGGG